MKRDKSVRLVITIAVNVDMKMVLKWFCAWKTFCVPLSQYLLPIKKTKKRPKKKKDKRRSPKKKQIQVHDVINYRQKKTTRQLITNIVDRWNETRFPNI